MTKRQGVTQLQVLLVLIVVAVVIWLVTRVSATYDRGVTAGQAECTAQSASAAVTSTVEAAHQVASQAQADMAHGDQAATANERGQVRIVTIYRTLESEARHAPPHPVDACVLPPDRLRIWTAANAGPVGPGDPADQGKAASQPHAAASAAAQPDIGLDARPGSQPPRGGDGLSPTGNAAVRPVAPPGDRAP